jgi:putative PEP-CTERM system histidine kinase
MHESFLPIMLAFLSVAMCVSLALLIMARARHTTVHWALATALGALAVTQFGNAMSLLAGSGEDLLYWRRVALAGEISMPLCWLIFSVTFARSNATELIQEWKPAFGASALLTLLFLGFVGSDRLFALASPDSMTVGLGPSGRIYAALYLMAQAVILANLEQTLRHAGDQGRWYIKFPVVGLGLLSMYFLYQMSDLLLYSVWHPELAWLSGIVTGVACVLIGYGLFFRPTSDVQIYISRKVVAGSLSFLLVGGVLIGTGLIASFIRVSGLPGSMVLSALFVLLAMTGLAFVLLSAHVRHGMSRFVERHFFPHKYDYRTRWLEVTETIGSGQTPEHVAWRAVDLFKGIFGANRLAIWRAIDLEEGLWARVAAHHVSETSGQLKDAGEVKAWLERQHEPFEVTEHDGTLPTILERDLQMTDAVLLIPLKASSHAIGWVALGSRADGSGYSYQDRDLLRCIAAQLADRLQHLMLADRFLMAREMEAFYEYSTFFLHDLKNFIATLSLVVQNAERHGEKPDFQRSAMMTIGSTVRKMTTLMGTVTALSRDPNPKLHVVDVNTLVDEVLKGFNGAVGATLIRQSHSVPLVEADPAQLQQVVLNLILNAQDAIGPDGRITLRTESDAQAAQLVVEDNGCGMDHATIAGLFRPFRSTKGKGLGIGLYQCRKILRAHGGTLNVMSEPGKGTRFVIRLRAHDARRRQAT